jgi:hypothetical protein
MTGDRDDVAQLFDQIAGEQDVIDRLAADALRLQAIQQAKRELASLDAATLRRAVAQRHAALAVGA